MQVVMNKCFLLNLEKNWRKSVLSFSEKTQKPPNSGAFHIRKNDVTELKAKYFNNQLNCKQVKGQPHAFRNFRMTIANKCAV